jgi:hypothetical protein
MLPEEEPIDEDMLELIDIEMRELELDLGKPTRNIS